MLWFEPKRQTDINLLTDQCKRQVQALLNLCKRNGMNMMLFETRRTLDRQKWLYAQGRTRNVGQRPVTWTMQSNHLTGRAADIVFVNSKGQPSWEGDWKKFKGYADFCGLKSLAPYEQCHVELP